MAGYHKKAISVRPSPVALNSPKVEPKNQLGFDAKVEAEANAKTEAKAEAKAKAAHVGSVMIPRQRNDNFGQVRMSPQSNESTA